MTKKKSELKPTGGVNIEVDFYDLKRALEELTKPKPEEWQLTITREDNGYSLKGTDNYSEVIEDRPDDELHSHDALLWVVMNFFGFLGGKHDPERLRVIREKKED